MPDRYVPANDKLAKLVNLIQDYLTLPLKYQLRKRHNYIYKDKT